MRAVGEMAEAAAVAIAGRDGGRAERAPVIAAHERKHQLLAGRLRTIFSESSIACEPPTLNWTRPSRPNFDVFRRDGRRQLHLLGVQILGRQLRQLVELPLQRVVQPRLPYPKLAAEYHICRSRYGVPSRSYR